jgi:undecaprenyl-diphosphatase
MLEAAERDCHTAPTPASKLTMDALRAEWKRSGRAAPSGRLRSATLAASAGAVLLSAAPAHASPPTQPLEQGQHFTIDPVADGLLIAGGAGFSGLLSLVLSTGEIAPSPPGDPNNLLSIDRGAVSQTIDSSAATISDIGLYSAIGFAVLDPILSGVRDGWDAGLVDAVLYAETLALTETLTDITKIAVRRPRPIDYINCPATATASSNCKSTDLQLSFFSGHASTVASIGATATYLAFERSPDTARPWITLGVSAALTSFVSYERVRSGAHFPTDVMAGAMAGIAVGVLVPHLHRHRSEAPPVWIGAAPAPGGGEISVGGRF